MASDDVDATAAAADVVGGRWRAEMAQELKTIIARELCSLCMTITAHCTHVYLLHLSRVVRLLLSAMLALSHTHTNSRTHSFHSIRGGCL